MLNKILIVLLFSSLSFGQSKNLILYDFSKVDSTNNYRLIFNDSLFNFNKILYADYDYTKINNDFSGNKLQNFLQEAKNKSRVIKVTFDSSSIVKNFTEEKRTDLSSYFKHIFPSNNMDTNLSIDQNIIYYINQTSNIDTVQSKIKGNKFFTLDFMPDTMNIYTKINRFPTYRLNRAIELIKDIYICKQNCCKSNRDSLPFISYENIATGCTERADYMDVILNKHIYIDFKNINSQKIFLWGQIPKKYSDGRLIRDENGIPSNWTSHAANLIINEDKGVRNYYVLDFAASDTLLYIKDWLIWHTGEQCPYITSYSKWHDCCLVALSGISFITPGTSYRKCDCLEKNPIRGAYGFSFSITKSEDVVRDEIIKLNCQKDK